MQDTVYCEHFFTFIADGYDDTNSTTNAYVLQSCMYIPELKKEKKKSKVELIKTSQMLNEKN